jgi:hypothetical protein
MMLYNSNEWVCHIADGAFSTVQVVHDHGTQTFMIIVSHPQEQGHVVIYKQNIYHNMKYQVANEKKFHQWRNEKKMVRELAFHNERIFLSSIVRSSIHFLLLYG